MNSSSTIVIQVNRTTNYNVDLVDQMKARYLSICHNCGKSIELGDTIRSEYDNSSEYWRAVHDDCRRPTEEVTDGEWKQPGPDYSGSGSGR